MQKRNEALAMTAPSTWGLPPPRPPMATLSIDIDFESEDDQRPSHPALSPDSSSRIRLWCSED